MAALGAGLLVGGIVAAATGTGAGLAVAAVIAGGGVATGGLSLWESRRFGRRAKRLAGRISEQRLLALAEKHGGTLRTIDVANELRVMTSEAEALLDRLVDEVRVSMRVTDEGEIHYVFREIVDVAGPRVRVEVAGAESVAETEPVIDESTKKLND
ncbi:MAG: hypothetical protein KJO40_03355 [Deltaproteobacteria bacterium]|nr:hypothetical protein [Deltaproteobacteria bacterium]NND29391.1 hypothetical protein [Myxococcales bacterium]MBT8466605.1 hypothetical protein [Deltaproteobacteria bacterium]MBT8482868.1 hypothetical protein [Deltaproteobacteria bacterium]NNK43760.1 hypothetical protein [Myxococcales bacterium]